MSQTLIDAAKAQIVAYNEKNWQAATDALTSDVTYDEVGTQRKLQGVADVLAAWKGWAGTLPDSKATIEAAYVSGNTVILEVTWRGTHTGALRTPGGDIPATGKKIQLRGCQVIDMVDGKSRSIRHYFDMATLLTQLGVNTVSA